eukprot:scaffold172784_cov28-Tisochrysis_lutea.AAC.1
MTTWNRVRSAMRGNGNCSTVSACLNPRCLGSSRSFRKQGIAPLAKSSPNCNSSPQQTAAGCAFSNVWPLEPRWEIR